MLTMITSTMIPEAVHSENPPVVGQGTLRGGARGAAGGAIAGEAKKGAAIGAASGGLIGGMPGVAVGEARTTTRFSAPSSLSE